ncbi:XdhC/CoxI family protein [Kineosporia sp. NBRC 101731]|uniref:XdhC family protein n=1 Tax=Kineosporia sp. NBRC 101731 TaxID=3032199 RepID=UPI0024A46DA7|nr:XdhC/CoxI family protein [Kineosporia sp. NBRC 101731]GLY29631.1 hypothetical protein Kisp02_29960 [Kineosporia sp. NBRC 101731]
MRDLIDELSAWWETGENVAVATVVATWNSAPRQPGSALVVGPEDSVVGSVSGGCVEGDVYSRAIAVRDGGVPVLQRYGVSDDDAFSVGLTCGGTIEIFVEQVGRETFPELGEVLADVRCGRPVAVATVIAAESHRPGRRLIVRPESVTGSLGDADLDAAVLHEARGLLAQGSSGVHRHAGDGGTTVFISSYAPRPRLIIFGAQDFAAALSRVGRELDYHVTVCDARATFATAKRFPAADEVVVEWPHRYLARTSVDERTALCVLTHDAKFDVPLLDLALRLPVGYVGALGSRQTVADRLEQLRTRGVPAAALAGLRAPIGLDLGARTPSETAISIVAEIVAAGRGGSGRPLSVLTGPIHRPVGVSQR